MSKENYRGARQHILPGFLRRYLCLESTSEYIQRIQRERRNKDSRRGVRSYDSESTHSGERGDTELGNGVRSYDRGGDSVNIGYGLSYDRGGNSVDYGSGLSYDHGGDFVSIGNESSGESEGAGVSETGGW